MPTSTHKQPHPVSSPVTSASVSQTALTGLIVVMLTACSSERSDAGAIEGATLDVDDRRFVVEEVRRCEPHRPGEDNIRLLVFGSDGLISNISVSHSPVGEEHELNIQGGGVGLHGGGGSSSRGEWTDQRRNALSGPPFEHDNERISGSLTVLPPTTGQDNARVVSFNLPIPAEQSDCSSR